MAIDKMKSPVIPWDQPGQKPGGGNKYGDLAFSQADRKGGMTTKLPIRRADSRYSTSKIRGLLEVSEGQRPAQFFYPYKYLPTCFVDVEVKDPVVIPKGTIVSAMRLDAAATTPALESAVTEADTQTTYISSDVGSVANNSYYGYPDQSTNSLLVPSNGTIGTDAAHYYTQTDVDFEVNAGIAPTTAASIANQDPNATNAPAGDTAGTNYLKIAPNLPLGYAYRDAFMDLRGKILNWEPVETDQGILCNWYVELFWINPDYDGAGGSYLPALHSDGYPIFGVNPGRDMNYQILRKYCGFAYGHIRVGEKVQADITGQTIPMINAATTSHSVGRAIAFDFRWPKDQMEYVETYPGSEMPGTETGGLPSHIYWPAVQLMNDAGTAPRYNKISDIIDDVQSGRIGVVRILINI